MPRSRPRRRTVALLILASAVVYLIGNGSVALWDRDEPRYAQTSRQMLQSGDWIVPRLLDEPREKKPVFIYWCQAASMAVFGENAFAARFPSAVFVTCTLIVMASVLWRTIGPRRAIWTTFIFATSGLTIAAAKMSITDGVLILFVTIAQLCLYGIWRGRGTWGVFIILGVATGFGILTKGPVVPAILAVTPIALFTLSRYAGRGQGEGSSPNSACSVDAEEPSPPPSPGVPGEGAGKALAKWTTAAIIAAAIMAPWLIAIERRLPGYTVRAVRAEVFERVKTAQEGHKGPPGYYLLTVWGTYFPWSILLPGALLHAWRNRRVPAIRFALAAVIGPWIAFEIVQTKLPHYILPIFAPLAFLTADLLVRASRAESQSSGFARVVLGWGIVVALAGSAPWLALRAFELPRSALLAMIVLSLLSAAYAYEIYVHFRARRPLDAAAIMGIGMMLLVAVLYGLYLPNATFLRISPRVAQVLIDHKATSRGDAIMIDYKEDSLPFYQGGTIRPERDNRFLEQAPPYEWPRWIVMTRRIWDSTPPPLRQRLEIVASVRGWWYANNGKVVEVLVVRKRSSLALAILPR